MFSILIVIFSILLSSLIISRILQKIKIPLVIGEIIGGLILGPTVLGILFPDFFKENFKVGLDQKPFLDNIYNVGLIVLMFLSGMETKISLNAKDKKTVSYLLIGTFIAFIVGFLSLYLYGFEQIIGERNDLFSLQLVFAIAVSVTSIPVITRIFLDLNLLQTKFAGIVITTATIQDMILWIILATLTNEYSSVYSSMIQVFLVTPILLFGILFILPRLSKTINCKENRFSYKSIILISIQTVFILGVVLYIFSTNKVLAAFLTGTIVNVLLGDKILKLKKYLKKVSLLSFIPLYFGIVGYKLNLVHNFNVYYFLEFLLMSSLIKILLIYTSSMFLKFNSKTSFNFSFAMNTRGGPGIVLATVAFETGIINEAFFTTLVITSIVTSLISGYWFFFISSKEAKNNKSFLQIVTK